MNITLLWMLAIPIVGAACFYYFNEDLPWYSSLVAAMVGFIIVFIGFYAGYGSKVADTELWNGKIVSKARVHDTYEESYSCNCHTTRSGNSTTTTCDTCYRTHYTVHWGCESTIGSFTIKDLDSLFRSVYSEPDPNRFTIIHVGDPVAQTHMYTNYVQAVPNSLFAAVDANLMKSFEPILPEEPIHIYDIYHVDRFLSPGFSFVDAPQWNADISEMLKDIGTQKQVNVSIVVAKTADRSYAEALRTKWEGVNKNDVVVVFGSLDGQKIEFVQALSWTKSEIFKVELIDKLQSLGTISRPQVISIIHDQILKNFERRHMREFKYLKGEIDPPGWVITLVIVILVLGYGYASFANKINFVRSVLLAKSSRGHRRQLVR